MASEAGATPAEAQATPTYTSTAAPAAAKLTAPTKKAADPNVKYEVVTVQMKDGTLKRFKRPIKPKVEGDATKKVEGATSGQAAAKPADAAATGQAAPAKSAAAVNAAADAKGNAKGDAKAPSASNTEAATKKADQKESKPSASDAKDGAAKATTTAAAPADDGVDKAQALEEQALYYKHRRRQAFKRALLGGAARVLASDIIDASELMDDDVEMSDIDSNLDSDRDNNDDHEGNDGNDDNNGYDNNGVREIDADNRHESDVADEKHGVQLNGAAVGNAAAAAVNTAPKQPTVTIVEKKGDGKETYKFTQRDLNALDVKAETNAKEMRLSHRWSAIGFYFMASLSIVLPLLFVLLSVFIFIMNGKSLVNGVGEASSWTRMPDVIKAGITLWPIVFAAVVAQAFKTWATYRVERGVSLGELEQLVGANSFAAAAKQPFLLRRIDLLTLVVFLSWCLSPIGSQALQRVYSVQRSSTTDNVTTIMYFPALGLNRMLSPNAETNIGSDAQYGTYMQSAGLYYMGSLLPSSPSETAGGGKSQLYQDNYNHPLPYYTGPGDGGNTAFLGMPLSLPMSVVNVAVAGAPGGNAISGPAAFENLTFPATTSYFVLDCGNWSSTTYGALRTPNSSLVWSSSSTLGLSFQTPSSNVSYPITGVNYATCVDAPYLTRQKVDGTPSLANASFMAISCGMRQVFLNITVICAVDVRQTTDGLFDGTFNWNCKVDGRQKVLQDSEVEPGWKTELAGADFSYLITQAAAPDGFWDTITPTERYANLAKFTDTYLEAGFDAAYIDQSSTGIANFAGRLGQLLNTMIGIGYCPECVAQYDLKALLRGSPIASGGAQLTPDAQQQIHYVNATHMYTDGVVYVVDHVWAGVTLAGTIVLFIIGTLSVLLESRLVAPDTLGYVSSAARNSRYLHLPKHKVGGAMSGAARARELRDIEVMMQDVKKDDVNVGKIALAAKTDKSVRLVPGRVYR